jgi:tRNA modification GTPase
LLNALAGQDVALVSPVAGTTRDVVELALQLAGYKVQLADTAGIRRSEDEIEAQGVARAVARLQGADLVLLVLAHPSAAALDVLEVLGPGRGQGGAVDSEEEEEEELRQLAFGAVELGEGAAPLLLRGLEHAAAAGDGDGDGDGGDVLAAGGSVLWALAAKPCLLVMNKNDLWPRGPGGQQEGRGIGAGCRLLPGGRAVSLYLPGESSPAARLLLHGIAFTSCVTQEGIPDLLQLLQQSVQGLMQPAAVRGQGHSGEGAVGGVSLVTRARHRQLLQECVAALQRYQAVCDEVDLAAEELRAAAVALGKLTGAVQVEEVLGAVFSEFCIGK